MCKTVIISAHLLFLLSLLLLASGNVLADNNTMLGPDGAAVKFTADSNQSFVQVCQQGKRKLSPDANLTHIVENTFLYLEQNKTNYKLKNPREQLVVESVTIDKLNISHVKFCQVQNSGDSIPI